MGNIKAGSVGVVLARFQPFHKSHRFLIEQSLKENEKTFVFIGSSDKSRMVRNPLTYAERYGYVSTEFPDKIVSGKLEIEPMPDLTDENDTDTIGWGNYLYNMITTIIEKDEFSIYYSDEPEIILSWFRDELAMKIKFRLYNRDDILSGVSATKIRQALIDNNESYLKAMLPDSVYNDREKIANIVREILEEEKR